MTRRLGFWLAAALIVAVGLMNPGVSDARTLAEILKAGDVNVGLNVKIPPRGLLNEKNEVVGFEADVANELARRLGVKINIVPSDSNDRIPYVSTGRIDMVLGGMTRTAERQKIIDFSVPISADTYGVITKKDSGVTKLSDLNKESATIVMVRGGSVLPTVQALLPKAQFLLLDSIPDRNRAFIQGRGIAIVDIIDAAGFSIVLPNPGVEVNIFAVPELLHSYSAVGVQKGNDSLRMWLNVALYEMHFEGFIRNSWKKWFLRDMDNYPKISEYF